MSDKDQTNRRRIEDLKRLAEAAAPGSEEFWASQFDIADRSLSRKIRDTVSETAAVPVSATDSCPSPVRWCQVKLGVSEWAAREFNHIAECIDCSQIRVGMGEIAIPLRGHRPDSGGRSGPVVTRGAFLKKVVLAAGGLMAAGAVGNFRGELVAEDDIRKLRAELSEAHGVIADLRELETLVKNLGLEDAFVFDGSPFIAATRDQLRLSVRFDERFVKSVRYRWSAEDDFQDLYMQEGRRPDTVSIIAKSEMSDVLNLNGRIVTAEMEVQGFDDEILKNYIPGPLTREFLLSPFGVVPDPERLDETTQADLMSMTKGTDEEHVNRYWVTGKLRQPLRKDQAAYLIIDAVAANSVWVASALEPDADGQFIVRAFLGDGARPATAVDNQPYPVFVVIQDQGQLPPADHLEAGKQYRRPVRWDMLNCVRPSVARIKLNDGQSGFVDHLPE